jgi:hypothetical protein
VERLEKKKDTWLIAVSPQHEKHYDGLCVFNTLLRAAKKRSRRVESR